MPWMLSMTLTVSAPLVFMYWFVGRALLNSVVERKAWDRRKTRRAIILTSVYLNLLPALAGATYLIGGRSAMQILGGESLLLDILVVYPFWIALVVVVQTFFILMVWELSKLLLLPVYRKRRELWSVRFPSFVIGAFILTSVYSVTTVASNTWRLRVNQREVRLPPQFSALDGLRIALVSDIQGDGRTRPFIIKSYVDKVNALEPDLILSGGDVVTSGEKYISSTIEILAGLRAPLGKFSAVGDHDIFSGRSRIVTELQEAGFVVLEDTTVELSLRETPVLLTVLTHTYRQKTPQELLHLVTDNALDAFKIMLVHQPAERLVHLARDRGYHLFAAGHTHGGAIAFGIPGIAMWAPSRVETRYYTGFYTVDQLVVAVTNGLGHTLTPIRYQAPAEITLITLRK
jgi:predicted MPP superfamily phosphohydrolase